eukprot:3878638-Pyramimonas_sp.AAC.2
MFPECSLNVPKTSGDTGEPRVTVCTPVAPGATLVWHPKRKPKRKPKRTPYSETASVVRGTVGGERGER